MLSYNRRSYSGIAPDATLTANMDDLTLTVTCNDLTGWPDGTGGPFEVTLEPGTTSEEKCWGNTRSGNTITLLARGMEGSAVAHSATTTTVRHGFSALDANEANYAVNQTVGQISAKGSIVVGSAANTFVELPVGSTGQALVVSGGTLAYGKPTLAESDVTGLVNDLAGKLAKPATAIAKGSILAGTGANVADSVAVGADNTVLTADSTATGGVSWQSSPALAPLATVDYTGTTGSFAGSLTALDTTNLTASFTVPTSGKVLVRVSGLVNRTYSGSGDLGAVGWKNHTGGATVGRQQTLWSWFNPTSASSDSLPFSRAQTLTGLTAGTLQLDLAGIHTGSGSTTISDVTIEVWAA